jgi:hypothetical protein
MTCESHLLVDSHVERGTEDLANGVMFCSRQGKATTTAVADVQTPKNSRAPSSRMAGDKRRAARKPSLCRGLLNRACVNFTSFSLMPVDLRCTETAHATTELHSRSHW